VSETKAWVSETLLRLREWSTISSPNEYVGAPEHFWQWP
jgi:hypothetical protein